MEIEIYMDHVLINKQKVTRPRSMARSYWLRFWEYAKCNPMDCESLMCPLKQDAVD
jgi:hypothetical protein